MPEIDVQQALDGELNEEQIKEFEGQLSEEGKKLFREAQAFKTKRQDEEAKGKDLTESNAALEAKQKELQEQIKADEERLKGLQESTSQFRQEQIDKAKAKFFADYGVKDEDKARFEETFAKLDSGKIDPDLIYQDYVGVYAFLNKDTLMQAEAEKKKQEAAAAAAVEGEAGGAEGTPPGEAPKKFSEAALNLAKEAGISPEAADRQLKEGNVRVYE